MFQIGEIVGIAQEIKCDEVSARQSVEQVSYEINNLENERESLESARDSLEAALDAAYNDVDEDGEPDRGRIAGLEARIAQIEQQICNVDNNLSRKRQEWNVYKRQLEATEVKKEKIIYEIEDRARKTNNNIHVSGGIYGAYSGVCTTIQNSLQSNMNTLSQAAEILGKNLSSYSTTGGSARAAHGNTNENSFMAGLRNAVVSDEEAANNSNDATGTGTSNYDNEVSEPYRDIPVYGGEERINISSFVNEIRKKVFHKLKGSNDAFIEIDDNGKTYYEEPGMREQIINLVNDGLPINPPYANKSSSNDNEDNEMSNEPEINFSNKKSKDDDRDERAGTFNNINIRTFDISKVKGLVVKLLEKDVYDITVVKDRFVPQKDVKPLLETKQQIRMVQYVEDGSKARIFDHPEELQNKLSYKQGQNERGMRGTCGLANLGVWLQIAGSAFREKDVVNCAATNIKADGKFLCSKEGGTLPEWRKQVWSMFGVDANVYRRGEEPDGELIERLAAAVESGRAVSVGLNAGKLWEQNNYEYYNYRRGKDNAFGDGGSNHVVGVVSCVRDFDTGEITHLYINDTGRGFKRDACRKVPVEEFKKAFCVERASVCISEYAIW